MQTINKSSRKKMGRPTKGEKPMTPAERAQASRTRMSAVKQALGEGLQSVQLIVSPNQLKRIRAFADELQTHPAMILTQLVQPLLADFLLYADRTPAGRLSDIDNVGGAAEVARNLREFAGLPEGAQPPTESNWSRRHHRYLKSLIEENASDELIAEIFNDERFEPPIGDRWTPDMIPALASLYGLTRKEKDKA